MSEEKRRIKLLMEVNKVGCEVVTDFDKECITDALGYIPMNKDIKGVADGVAELDKNGTVPAVQLPSYVDDIINGYLHEGKFYEDEAFTIEITPESGKIYVNISDNKTYRWSGLDYTVISESLALGENSSTAYRGDRGKIAYDHSQSNHAPVDAEKNQNAFSNIVVGDKIITSSDESDNLNINSGENISIDVNSDTKTLIINAIDTTYKDVTEETSGLMNPEDYKKLNNIEDGANKTIIDNELSLESENPVQNKVLTESLNKKLDNTTKYAGSSSVGGSANSAVKLDTNAGAKNIPVYFENGIPKSCNYELNKSVPSDASFEPNTWRGIQNNLTSDSTEDSLSAKQGKILKGLIDGLTFNGTKVNSSSNNFYICNTAADVQAKIVGSSSDTNFTKADASLVNVFFVNGNTNSDITLKVGSTSASFIYWNNQIISENSHFNITNPYYIQPNTICTFIYYNNKYHLISKSDIGGIENNLESDSIYNALSAKQGKVLNDKINALTFNGNDVTDGTNTTSTDFVICSTAAATAEKYIDKSDFTFASGAQLTVLFSNGNTSTSNLTLKVGSNTAKSIYLDNAAFNKTFDANTVYKFVYNSSTSRFYFIGEVNTHYTSNTIVNSSASSTANTTKSITTNGSVYLNHIENGVVKNSHKISGTNNATVTADASGNIIIDSAVQTSVTGSSGSCTGNAATATKLANARTINGVSFDGTSNITIPRSTKKIHCAVGTNAKTGYIKFCTLTVTGTYANHAVKFVMSQRSRPPYDLFVQFSSVNSTDCTIDVFSYTSNANQGASIYYVKTGTGVFDLYVQKVEAYDHLYVLDVLKADGHEGVQYTITFTDVHATSLPSGYVKASASIQGHTHSYLPLSGGTLTGKTTFSGGLAITTGPENTSMPFFLGIDAFADGGEVKYITASKVCAAIGAAASSHGTHVTFSTTAPKANGTAAVGTATTVSRSDHVHPLQTTVSGNAGTATKLANSININGLSIDGSTSLTNYGVCSTAAGTAAKVVNINSSSCFELVTGAEISVRFSYMNTVANPTLNVNGTGAKNIRFEGSNLTSLTGRYLRNNHICTFRYDGSYWVLIGNYRNDVRATNNTANASYPLLTTYFSGVTTTIENNGPVKYMNTVYANPSTGSLYATRFSSTGTNLITSGVARFEEWTEEYYPTSVDIALDTIDNYSSMIISLELEYSGTVANATLPINYLLEDTTNHIYIPVSKRISLYDSTNGYCDDIPIVGMMRVQATSGVGLTIYWPTTAGKCLESNYRNISYNIFKI